MRKQYVSSLIGTVKEDVPVQNYTVTPDGEKYLLLSVSFREIVLDVVVSEYIYNNEKGKLKFTGGLCVGRAKNDEGQWQKHYFFFAKNIEPAEEDAKETNEVHINAKMTQRKNYIVSNSGLELLFIFGSIADVAGNISVVKLCFKGALARKYKNIEEGEFIEGYGYMKAYKGSVEIVMSKVTDEES